VRSRKAAKIYDAGPAPSPVLLLKQHKEMLAMAQASSAARCAINEAAPPRSQLSGLAPSTTAAAAEEAAAVAAAQAAAQAQAQREAQAAAQARQAVKEAVAAAAPSLPCESPAAPRDEDRLPPAKRPRSEVGGGGDGGAAQGGSAEGGGGRAGAGETAARPPKTKATETRAKARRPAEAGGVACAFDPKALQTVDARPDARPATLRHASSSAASSAVCSAASGLQPEPATEQPPPAGSQRTRRGASTASADAGAGAGAGVGAGAGAGGAAAATEETPEVPQLPAKRQRGSLPLALPKNKSSPAQAARRQAAAVQSAPVREAPDASPGVSAITPASSTALSAVAADGALGTPALRREAEAPLAKSDEALSAEVRAVVADFSQRQLASGVTQRQLDRVLQNWYRASLARCR